MHTLNTQKFQNTPRGKNGKAVDGAKRIRLPQDHFTIDTIKINGRFATLHPTKGWRSRNAAIVERHGTIVRELDFKKQQAIYLMKVAQQEREKQRTKRDNP